MPIFDYKCKYGHITEELYRRDERVYATIECEICTEIAYKQLPMVASTPAKWGDSHGYFNKDLNCYIRNSQHHDQVLKEQGLAVTTTNALMDQAQRKENWIKETDKKTAEYKQFLADNAIT